MSASGKFTGLSLLLIYSLLATVVQADTQCDPDGLQASGSIYRVCMPLPGDYNGDLVIWAHGFQDAGTPVQIPEDQLVINGIAINAIVNGLGYGFITNSYSKTGLAVRQGMDDILDLVDIFTAEQGAPQRVFLVGASEGGLITTLLLEQHPETFTGGFAMCGPIGSFPYQINYFGDARVTFNFFFPGLIPGELFDPPQSIVDDWAAYYEQLVKPVVFDPANSSKLDQWVAVAKLPFDTNDYLNSLQVSVKDVLRYAVVNSKDATQTLGGLPYNNRYRLYAGSNNDLLLNLLVQRFDADAAAIQEMKTYYNTTGMLDAPLVTMHTLLDQQVPYQHQSIYSFKTFVAGDLFTLHQPIVIDRFEHCNFETKEALFGLVTMLQLSGGLPQAE